MGFIDTLIAFIYKICSVKYSGSLLLSFITSSSLAVVIETLNKIFFKDADVSVFIPIVVWFFMAFIYFFMVLADFYFGVRVALEVKKEKFNAKKIPDTTVKFVTTILVTTGVTFLCLLAQASKSDWLSFPSTALLLFVWAVFILGDYVSIGDNIEKLNGSKPKMFYVVERSLGILIKSFFTKVSNNSFNPEKENNEKDNIDNPS